MPATTYPTAKSPQKYRRRNETSFEPVRDGDPHDGTRHHPLDEQPYRACQFAHSDLGETTVKSECGKRAVTTDYNFFTRV